MAGFRALARMKQRFAIILLSPTAKWTMGFLASLIPLLGIHFLPIIPPPLLVSATGASLFLVGYYLLYPFTRAGIYASFDTTTKGIDFRRSLSLAHSRLDFLGVGADKLTRQPEFEQALVRLSRAGAPVRLPLSRQRTRYS
jgi:hypothetical protein